MTRFSALGDVAISIPVVRQMAIQHPEHHFYMISMPMVVPLFREIPNLTFIAFDKKGQHKGWLGAFRLFRELQRLHIDALVDLHDVLRTKELRLFFRITGKKVVSIHKGRHEKRLLTKNGFQHSAPLTPTIERYQMVFEKLGLQKVNLDKYAFSISSKPIDRELNALFGAKHGDWIGIAPFAQHKGKQLPLKTIEEIIAHFSEQENTTVFLFGAGKTEGSKMQEWTNQYINVISVANRFEIDEEVMLMKRLDMMLTMDSANMHLASLAAVPVLSVWGATHPYAGFYGFHQLEDTSIQLDLACRPCSVFGNKPCRFGTYECLERIDSGYIIQKMNRMLQTKKESSLT
ncbi:glycosyltransferase family 9 protein [Microbacter margulisiae]|uniref:ADP-heptose:LPS heptosyltransferase n=1 Tax=Microbacter margulisiae TaxID=1350067 RepID=A0A7W5DPQ9_9PORP|nr:ADP-heptose:LPS heptosyltransferase [Microbacter margulisiae]